MIQFASNVRIDCTLESISRQDTRDFTEKDIIEEVREWEYILKNVLHQTPSYIITSCSMSSRAKNFLAQTGRKRGAATGFITVNSNFLKYHTNPDIFHSVLAHETIHTMTGCFDHKQKFKAVGSRLMAICKGVKISRTIGDPGYNEWHRQEVSAKPHNWKIVCKNCGQVIWRDRACDITKHPNHYKCGVCKGQFEVFHIENGMEVKYLYIAV